MIGEPPKKSDRIKLLTIIYTQLNRVIHGHVIEWTNPAYGRYKCNIDAFFFTL